MLQVNVPFAKALANMPTYAKFLNETVSNKQKLEEFAIVSLIEECVAMLQNRLPIKLRDSWNFIALCSFENIFVDRCSCDVGSSINLMPLSFLGNQDLPSLLLRWWCYNLQNIGEIFGGSGRRYAHSNQQILLSY